MGGQVVATDSRGAWTKMARDYVGRTMVDVRQVAFSSGMPADRWDRGQAACRNAASDEELQIR